MKILNRSHLLIPLILSAGGGLSSVACDKGTTSLVRETGSTPIVDSEQCTAQNERVLAAESPLLHDLNGKPASGADPLALLPACTRICLDANSSQDGLAPASDKNGLSGWIGAASAVTPGSAPASCALPEFQKSIASPYLFDRLSQETLGAAGSGGTVKILIDNRDQSKRADVYFMNARFQDSQGRTPESVLFHFNFAMRFVDGARALFPTLESFNDNTYHTADDSPGAAGRSFFALRIQKHFITADKKPTYAVHSFGDDVMRNHMIVRAMEAVADALSLRPLVYVQQSDKQSLTSTNIQVLKDKGVDVVPLEDIIRNINYIPVNPGSATGILRMFPENSDDLTPFDIPVFRELPLFLSVVSGTITKAYQDATSHVNLKSKERNTPNMVLRDVERDKSPFSELDGEWVHLTVKPDGYEIRRATDAERREALKAREVSNWRVIAFDQQSSALTRYQDMCPGSPNGRACFPLSRTFGSKAASLGFLQQALGVPDGTGAVEAPIGFGIPFSFYARFLEANPLLKAKVEAFARLLKTTDAPLGRALTAASAQIKEDFLKATFPAELLEQIHAQLRAMEEQGRTQYKMSSLDKLNKFKFRSSANAEDIPGFNGAGLYDSFSGRLKDIKETEPCRFAIDPDDGDLEVLPKKPECAIKGVYASLWNRRAIEERTSGAIDHEAVAMAIAVVPKYDFNEDESPEQIFGRIQANGVVVTRTINAESFGYTISLQAGNNVTTNPDAETSAESLFAVFLNPRPSAADITYQLLSLARPNPDDQSDKANTARRRVVQPEALTALVQSIVRVEKNWCLAKNALGEAYHPTCLGEMVFDPNKEKALDLEFKMYPNGQFLLKQAREFRGR